MRTLEFLCPSGRVAVLLEFDRHRTLRLRVNADGTVRLRAPWRLPEGEALRFLQSRAEWICRHVERCRESGPEPERYEHGARVRHLGEALPLAVSPGGRNLARQEHGFLRVSTAGEPTPDKVRRAVEAWRLREAAKLFAAELAALLPAAAALGLPAPTRLRVRRMKSRWGSCTASGAVTLNSRLLEAPALCIAFVIAHELCHLRIRRHDAAFYALLTRLMPDWRERRARLRAEPIL